MLLFGIAALLVPAAPQSGVRIGLLLIGLGCAPIYPTIIHETPQNFGVTNLQAVIGLQMATAYVGSTLAPPLFGVLSSSFGVASYLVFLLSFAGLMMVVLLWRNHQLG